MMDRPLNSRKRSGEKEMEMWYQIRRTEEESMESGTMETALLHEHRVWTARVVRSVEGLRMSVAQSTSATALCFPWRSGDEIADGEWLHHPGHDDPLSLFDDCPVGECLLGDTKLRDQDALAVKGTAEHEREHVRGDRGHPGEAAGMEIGSRG